MRPPPPDPIADTAPFGKRGGRDEVLQKRRRWNGGKWALKNASRSCTAVCCWGWGRNSEAEPHHWGPRWCLSSFPFSPPPSFFSGPQSVERIRKSSSKVWAYSEWIKTSFPRFACHGGARGKINMHYLVWFNRCVFSFAMQWSSYSLTRNSIGLLLDDFCNQISLSNYGWH